MPVYVALLRGINVGKSRRVAMADLRAALTDAGHDQVATHVQTGNVVFKAPKQAGAALERSLEKTIRDELALDIDVMVRTPAQLAKVVSENPLATPRADPKALHVAFLKAKPPAAAAKKLAGVDFGEEQFALRGTELYLRYPDGYGRSKMTGAFFEKLLATPATVRNWNVTTKLAELAQGA